ncbi:sensor histidine kinase [Thermoflavifilum thermophilum]|uniref:Histidine kinase n=1 Tax=Thermoflavifilum thermophilum TaxID=1393122 RepID=A0A1I7NDM9_9BACT|nr:histidine kinase [Thermoflavifilum thermophilum]SFV32784.1 Histidine kinase [Thermoflavifilum thermophilum]
MKNLLLICIIGLACFLWNNSYAQEPDKSLPANPINLSARYFSLSQGLPAQSLYGCVQDKRGFLWIATENGIARFDGFQFRRYGIQDGLPDLDVLNTTMDSIGTIWALPFQKPPVYYDWQTDHFYVLPSLAARDFRSYRAFVLSQSEIALCDIHGRVYIVHTRYRQIMDSFDFHTLVYQIVKLPANRYGVLLSDKYLMLQNHQLLFASALPIQVRFAVSRENIMFCGTDSTLLQLDIQTGNIAFRKKFPFSIRQIDKAPDGLYATTLQGEIYLINPVSLQIQRKIWQNASANEVYDRGDGLIWICTKEEGLIQLRQQYIKSFFPPSAPHVSNLNCILPFDNGIVAGNNQGECIFWTYQQDQQVAHLSKQILTTHPNLDAWIRKIFYNDPYFLIVSQTGLYQLHPGKNPVRIFPQYFGFKVAARVDDSTYWLGSHGYLYLLRYHRGRYDIHLVASGKRITAIAPLTSNECYVGSDDGLYHVQHGRLTKMNMHGCIGQQKIQVLTRDSRGWIWVAYGGDSLLAFQNKNIRFLIKTSEHFPGDIIKCLYADENDIWVGTNNCLGKIHVDSAPQLHVYTTFFSVYDGLAGEQINDIQRYGHNLFIATSNGISYFPASFTIPAHDIPVYIMNMQTGRHKYAALDKHVVLSYKENFIRFDLSAIDYSGLPAIWFRYRLNNHHWIFTKNPVIYLYELPPGVYKLEVQAIRRDGMPSALTATESFEIRAPFFTKPIFWFALILAILIMAAFLLWRIYSKKHRRRMAQLEQEKKITELETQMLRAQINPHFIFNTLNAIKQMMYENDFKQANAYLDRFSALLRFTLYTRYDAIVSLHQELTYLSQYLELEKLRFGDQFEYHIEIENHEAIASVGIPAMLLLPVVENAVKHGIRKLKTKRGLVKICISFYEQTCRIEIMDNGPGISMHKTSVAGKGLEITRKRAEWHHIRFDLQRKTDADQSFTVAVFEIPVQHAVALCQPSVAIS